MGFESRVNPEFFPYRVDTDYGPNRCNSINPSVAP
jgi:hypothetical protein